MSHRFDDPLVDMKRVFDELFAVSGNGASRDLNPGSAERVDSVQLFCDQRDGITAVGTVIRIQDRLVLRILLHR